MKKFFKKLFGVDSNADTIQFKQTLYCCVINDKMTWYDTKEEMLNFIESYSRNNTIYSLSMFRNDMYNLVK